MRQALYRLGETLLESLTKHDPGPGVSAVRLITDGACLDNGRADPRGGWAAILIGPDGGERVLTGAEAPSTNNRMELTAAIEGLAAAPAGSDVEVLTDSAYLANGVNQGWIENWKRKGWVTAKWGQSEANQRGGKGAQSGRGRPGTQHLSSGVQRSHVRPSPRRVCRGYRWA